MRLKSILLGLAVSLAFTMPIYAAQYTVPEGQPPVPGADSSIPDNAYQNYRYGDIRKVPDFEIQEVLKLRYKEIDELVRDREISVEDAEALKKVNVKYMDLTSHDSTVILLHEDGFNAKMTAPIRAVAGIFTPLKSDGITSFAVDRYALASLSGTIVTPEDNYNENSEFHKGMFIYPGFKSAYWSISDESVRNDSPMMLAYVTFDSDSNRHYIVGLSKFHQPNVKELQTEMANVVIPSIQPLDELARISDLVKWDNITYRLPKGMMLKAEEKVDSEYSRRVYYGQGLELVIDRGPIVHDDSAMSGYFNRIFADYLYGSSSPLLRDIPIQSAIVWNNGVPTYLMDQHNLGKQSRIFQLIQDDQYEYDMYLTYEDGKAKYNHIELRNIMEYLDFKNAKELRRKAEIKIKK